MDFLYPYFLTLHLICAIIFLGYIFCDIVLLSLIRKKLGDEVANRVFGVISQRGVKIMPLCLLLLVISGGAMISRWVGFEKGFLDSLLQQLLMLKVLFALVIVAFVILSLSCHYVFKIKNPFAKIVHKVAFVLGFLIVILAKVAFYF
ncbi:copper resistance protein CopD [Helicobacter monodelphidis]|uniref:copper resistance protein CopD n=1 Tax=Helicobacter sp. 15-1451 TaxID=2004995 RepID=UPI000DCE49D7|nr:copper resistance protein CopD [Helicobacter sp. 15-1451]RAX56760.1 copper resistance protein CopD [Helicobacter sp. 15-1451]